MSSWATPDRDRRPPAGLPPQATEADIRNLLDDLGPPDSIVAAARPGRRAGCGLRELFALLLPRAAVTRAAALATATPELTAYPDALHRVDTFARRGLAHHR